MQPALLKFILVCSLGVLAASDPMQWRLCDDFPATDASVSQVTLFPDPPVIGTPATFVVEGQSGTAVQAGTVEIDVSFGGIQIFSQSEDICSKTDCPVSPGPIKLTIVEALPPIAPPGDYGLRVTARDETGQGIMCIDVDFTLVLPSLNKLSRREAPGATAVA